MKYPALLGLPEVLSELARFDAIIDVRSPAEFAEDHLPGAINCPVLDNAERITIGTLYKQVNAFEAKKAGAVLVARNIAQHIESTFLQQSKDWRPLIYCWRGGNRSGAMAHILAKVGWPAVQLDGGYKAYRRHVNDSLPELATRYDYRVVCGTTGSGKSRLLQTLAAQDAQVLDLEQLAEHRGSVLGGLPSAPQPSQKMFESRLWQTLRSFDAARPVYVESESKKVGNVRIPDALMVSIRAAQCITLDLSQPHRVALLMQEYAHFVADPEALIVQLDCLVTLYGKERIAQWHTMARAGDMPALVEDLLIHHYDPAYIKSIDRNFAHIARARPLHLADISIASFEQAAHELLAS